MTASTHGTARVITHGLIHRSGFKVVSHGHVAIGYIQLHVTLAARMPYDGILGLVKHWEFFHENSAEDCGVD